MDLDILRIKIAYIRLRLYILKRLFFLPQNIKNSLAEPLTKEIRLITEEVIRKGIV
ncbi:hypothetical protein [Clostridium sp. HBUAS56017]|uniref:hypothetical protein n=1 Tax=Clostridium sp. HBUAS56017 TaxID=2571128 RepID=UPI00163DC883|nr:hypothetical protein [Clostridium sp. HBUAS56017]